MKKTNKNAKRFENPGSLLTTISQPANAKLEPY